jgi:hypothetical phage related protein|nr:MAG TPA: tail protein [Caudoviricetes sp.]
MDDFIRWKTVDILEYLPFFIAKDELFKTTNDADSREHERIRVQLLKLLSQLNIQNATDGIKLWDTFVGIDTSADGIDVRRARIIERLNHNSTSTKEFLEYIANQYISDESARISLFNHQYAMDLEFNKGMCFDLARMKEAIDTYKPAHIGHRTIEVSSVAHDIQIGIFPCISESTYIGFDSSLRNEVIPMEIKTINALAITENTIII